MQSSAGASVGTVASWTADRRSPEESWNPGQEEPAGPSGMDRSGCGFLGPWDSCFLQTLLSQPQDPGQQQPPELWPQPEPPDCWPLPRSQELDLCLHLWDLRLWWLRKQPPSELGTLQPPELVAQQEEAAGRHCAVLFGGHLGEEHLGGGWHCFWFCWQDILAGVSQPGKAKNTTVSNLQSRVSSSLVLSTVLSLIHI